MKITIELNDIDYGALAEQLLPLVQAGLAQKDDAGSAILSKLAGMPPAFAGKMVDMLPQETKDEIAVMLVNSNKEKIMDSVLEFAAKKGLSFRIDSFDVE